MKVLLVQTRRDPTMRDHEKAIIIEHSGLEARCVTPHNVVEEPHFPLRDLDQYDGVIMGGAGAFSVLNDDPHIPFLEDIARYCKDTELPFLGICYGLQIAVQALGGEVVHDPEGMEAGSYAIFRTTPANGHPVLQGVPKRFTAACGRKDRAEVLPDGMVNHLRSIRCKYSFMTFPGSNFNLVQFHPELWRKDDNLVRVHHYKQRYGLSEAEFTRQLGMYQDAPESKGILANFVDVVRNNNS